MEGFDRDDVESIFASSSIRDVDEGVRCFYGDPSLISIGSMPYRGFRVGLFVKKVGDADRIYYEPIAVLDPKSIAFKSHSANQVNVNFTLEMWNATLEDKVAKYLLKDPKLVQVMPYEEVRIIDKSGGGSFQLPNRPTSYLQLDEQLNFSVICDVKEMTELVTDPKSRVLVQKLTSQLSIECKSPATGQPDETFHYGALGVKRLNRLALKLISEMSCVIETPKLEAAMNGIYFLVAILGSIYIF